MNMNMNMNKFIAKNIITYTISCGRAGRSFTDHVRPYPSQTVTNHYQVNCF